MEQCLVYSYQDSYFPGKSWPGKGYSWVYQSGKSQRKKFNKTHTVIEAVHRSQILERGGQHASQGLWRGGVSGHTHVQLARRGGRRQEGGGRRDKKQLRGAAVSPVAHDKEERTQESEQSRVEVGCKLVPGAVPQQLTAQPWYALGQASEVSSWFFMSSYV